MQSSRSLVNRASLRVRSNRPILWVIGDGRSGTTWVQEMISRRYRFRMMYEPFHPESGKLFTDYSPNLYIPPFDRNHPLLGAAGQVFSGLYCTDFTDSGNRLFGHRGLIIKDIFANLLAGWAMSQFPDIKIVLLVRNPVSVALSKRKTDNWHWPADPSVFLDQSDLLKDHGTCLRNISRFTNSEFVVQQVLVWSVLNAIPLRQFCNNSLYLLFYEDVFARPNDEIQKLMHHSFGDSIDTRPPLQKVDIEKLSRGSHDADPYGSGIQALQQWRSENRSEFAKCLNIVQEFGLDYLYGDGLTPKMKSGPLRAAGVDASIHD